MKYDQYGDPIPEIDKKLSGKRLSSLLITLGILALLSILNLVILAIPALGGFLTFILAPFALLVFVSVNKGTSALADEGFAVKKFNIINIALLVVYIVTAVLCFFKG